MNVGLDQDPPTCPCEGDANWRRDNAPILIGDSHAGVMFFAARRSGFELRGSYFGEAPQPPYNLEFTELHPDIAKALELGRVFSAVSRSMHDVLTLLQHPRSFDVILPEMPHLSFGAGAELVPYDAMRDALKRHMARDFKLLELIRAGCGDRLVHIISPPPVEDNQVVAETSPWPLAAGQTVSSPALRFKIYRIYASLLTEWCVSKGVGVIDPPRQALNKDGFLEMDYVYNATHANEAYGALVLAQMQAWL